VAESRQWRVMSYDIILQQAIRRLQHEEISIPGTSTEFQEDTPPEVYDFGLRFRGETPLDEPIPLGQLMSGIRSRHPSMPLLSESQNPRLVSK